MVWGCCSYEGLGTLTLIKGKMKAKQYREIFKKHLVKSANKFKFRSFKFLHDNDPKHITKIVKEYLANIGVEMILFLFIPPT
jgi:hypothetical protein